MYYKIRFQSSEIRIQNVKLSTHPDSVGIYTTTVLGTCKSTSLKIIH